MLLSQDGHGHLVYTCLVCQQQGKLVLLPLTVVLCQTLEDKLLNNTGFSEHTKKNVAIILGTDLASVASHRRGGKLGWLRSCTRSFDPAQAWFG